LIVCLAARPEVIARRVSAGVKNRPMLAHRGSSLKERIAELIEARAEAYARATITVDTSDRTIDQLVDDILTAIAEHGLQQLETAESARPA
jgi:shikimate kinase